MRIGIDATAIGPGPGASNYMLNLTRNLLHLDVENEYVVYCRRQVPEELRTAGHRARFEVTRLGNRKLAEQVWLSRRAPFDGLDVLHCCWSLPLVRPGTCVLTAHGFSWMLMPELFPPGLRMYWKLGAERTIRKAARVISISEWTKQLCMERLGISGERIDVVYHGVDLEQFRPIGDADTLEQVRKRYDLPERYLLFLGSTLPVKNVGRLVGAFARLCQRGDFEDYRLVIAGGQGWGHDAVLEAVNRLGVAGRVSFPGFVRGADLPALYSAATLFVVPSLYEGFGIPILESFACGTPVIASNASCLPEVAGDAALLFDPNDEEDLAGALERALSDDALRERMVRRGLERAGGFTWERAARKSLETYTRACA